MYNYTSRSNPNTKSKSRWIFLSLLAFGTVSWFIFLCQDSKYRRHIIHTKLPQTYSMFLLINKNNVSGDHHNISELSQIINEHNANEKILNIRKFGVIHKDTIIIVILQVGHNIDYLKYFLASLSNSKGIQDTLVIFSHFHYDEKVNYLIGKINYCKVLQIFYPLSINKYRGSGNDAITDASAKKCSGTPTSEKGCPSDAERKLHWWWTANMVFDKLKYTSNHDGLVVYAEDDLYFLEDSIYMLSYTRNISKTMDECDFVSIGENSRSKLELHNTMALEVVTWNAKDFATVIGFDISAWNTIVSHYDVFCNVDDDSWSRSLYYLTVNRKDSKKYRVITPVLPRAYKLSVSEHTHNILLSSSLNRLYDIFELQQHVESQLYPSKLEIVTNILLKEEDTPIYEFPQGGWSDPKDRELCFNTTINKFSKVLLDMEVAFIDYL